MDSIELGNPMFLASLVLGACLLVASSAAYQMYGPDSEGQIKPKALLRDGLLGGIFAAMAWTLVPESMKGITESISSTIGSATTTAVETASSSIGLGGGPDLQVGPARF
jgi:hypothetical protein